MRLQKSKFLIWTIILFVSTSLPAVVEVILSWSSQLTFKQEETQVLKHFIKFEVIFAFSSLVLMIPMLIQSIRKYYLILICISILPINLFYLIHVLLFGSNPNSASLFSIFSTNSNESWEFASDFLTFKIVAVVIIYPVLIFLFYKLLSKIPFLIYSRFVKILILVIFASFGVLKLTNKLDPVSFYNLPIIEIGSSFQSFKKEQKLIEKMLTINYRFKSVVQRTNADTETHIIIIGESTSRHHMGIYGYWRNTTPFLEKNKSDFIFFDNVTTPNAHTIPALTKAFSLSENTATLMDLLNQANIESHWISNQAIVGEYETPIYLFASKTNTKTFVNSGGFAKQYDINVLPKLKQLISKPTGKRIIFIHLLGTHLSYKERYPDNFNVFNNYPAEFVKDHNSIQQKFINEYDNANKYNDFVINSIVNEVEKSSSQATITYFSDHGDEVYDMRNFHGHSDVLQSHYMTDIPFLFWANPAFKENHKNLIKTLHSAKSKSFSLQNFSHFAQDIIGVHCEMYNADKSIASPHYWTKGKKEFKTKKPKTANDIPNLGIWVHRVNGIDRLNEVKDMFNGFEIDIVYNLQNDYFDVNHPPAESIGLSLLNMIKTLEKPADKFYWLDLKNLNNKNCESALERLIYLSNIHGLKRNLIVESQCLECLQKFNAEGFFTSKYLPFYHQKTELEMNSLISVLSDSLRHISISAVSQEINALPILKSRFNDCDLLVWDLSLNWKKKEDRLKANQLLKDSPSIKVLLVRYETSSYR